MCFDVRFRPTRTGIQNCAHDRTDKPVAAFLDRHTEVHNFIYRARSYLELWLPMLETSNRNYLTVAIGCTGETFRSVYIAGRWQTTSARAVKMSSLAIARTEKRKHDRKANC